MKSSVAFAWMAAAAVSTLADTAPVPSEASSSVASSCQPVVLRLRASASSDMGVQDWRLFSTEVSAGTCALNCRVPRGGIIILR